MNIQGLVTGAKLGNNDDFGTLVRLFREPLLATLERITRDPHGAEELVQETFLRAWTQLASLRNAEAFPSWLWRIGRNLACTWLRQRARDPELCDAWIELRPDTRSPAPGRAAILADPAWEALVRGVDQEGRMLLELRYVAAMSLGQISMVFGLSQSQVKGRLFRLRKRCALASPLPHRHHPLAPSKEDIMDIISTQKLGAHVFMRLSLAAQETFARHVIGGKAFPDTVLSAIGQVDRGAEFLGRYGATITLKELIGILNNVDRFTEMRLVEHLEQVSPQDAEAIKQNMFVFEDLVLFDPPAIRLMVAESDQDILAGAVAGTDLRTRTHILSALEPMERRRLEERVAASHGGFNLSLAAQEAIVNVVKDLEAAGRLVIYRKDEVPDGQVFITVSPGS